MRIVVKLFETSQASQGAIGLINKESLASLCCFMVLLFCCFVVNTWFYTWLYQGGKQGKFALVLAVKHKHQLQALMDFDHKTKTESNHQRTFYHETKTESNQQM